MNVFQGHVCCLAKNQDTSKKYELTTSVLTISARKMPVLNLQSQRMDYK